MQIDQGGRKSALVVTRLKTAVVVPLQQLLLDYSAGLNTEDFILRACQLVAMAINEPNITAKTIEENSTIEELMAAVVAMKIWCMAVLGGNNNPKVAGVPEHHRK